MFTIVAVLLFVSAWYLLTQYVLPAPSAQHWAEHYRVARRHLESVRSWEARTVVAAEALHAAVDAFTAEAERLGRLERVSERGLRWSLPSAHPRAVALTVARYPDGLPAGEVARISEGLDVAEYGVTL